MKNTVRALALFLALQPVLAAAQTFPTVPDRSVIGRIGAGGSSGPSQAIPFSLFGSQILGNGFIQFTGPTSPTKTFTLPNANDTISTLNAIQTFTAAKTFNSSVLFTGAIGTPTVNGQGYVGASPSGGGTLSGQGSICDVNLVNKGGSGSLCVLTGTVNVAVNGTLTTGVQNSVQGSLAINWGGGAATTVITNATNGGNPTLQTPNASGTIAVSASAPLVLNATTGNMSIGTLQAAQEPAHTGDCTNSAGSLALTCLNTNGVALTATATAAAGQLPGEPSTGNAAAGKVGEFIFATATSTAISTGAGTTITSISLTAGDWEIYGNVAYFPAATTNITDIYASISLTTNVLDQTTFNYTRSSFASAGIVPGTNKENVVNVGPKRLSISGNTTVFLVGFADFSVSTLNTTGGIRARRVR